MCLIVSKPRKVRFPKGKQLKRWFDEHDDGFGLMFQDKDKVHIMKGAMTLSDMFKLINKVRDYIKPTKLDNIHIIMHFRQATGGKVCPENCHPFPVGGSGFGELDTLVDMGLVHNGIIWDYGTYSKGTWEFGGADSKTDTQEFIEDYLTEIGDAIFNPSVQAMIEDFSSSKFAVMSGNTVALIGDFIKDKGGLMFSNGGYKPIPNPIPVAVEKVPANFCQLPAGVKAFGDDYEEDNELFGSTRRTEQCDFCEKFDDVDKMIDTGDYFLCRDCSQEYDKWWLSEDSAANTPPFKHTNPRHINHRVRYVGNRYAGL